MTELAPRLCPVCDLKFDDYIYDDEQGQIYIHQHMRERCIKKPDGTTETNPIILPHVPAPRDVNENWWDRYQGL